MVIVMKPGTPEQEWKKIKENLEGRGYQINERYQRAGYEHVEG